MRVCYKSGPYQERTSGVRSRGGAGSCDTNGVGCSSSSGGSGSGHRSSCGSSGGSSGLSVATEVSPPTAVTPALRSTSGLLREAASLVKLVSGAGMRCTNGLLNGTLLGRMRLGQGREEGEHSDSLHG